MFECRCWIFLCLCEFVEEFACLCVFKCVSLRMSLHDCKCLCVGKFVCVREYVVEFVCL